VAARLTIGRGLISIKAHYDLGSLALGLVQRLAFECRRMETSDWGVESFSGLLARNSIKKFTFR